MAMGFHAKDYTFAPTGVSFRTADSRLQEIYNRGENFLRENEVVYNDKTLIKEGAVYSFIWLETQPMGGEMYAVRDVEIALNNVLIFMECQRRDGRMPGMITYRMPWDGLSVHMDWMQGDFFTIPAYKLSFRVGQDKAYLQRLYTALRDFDEYLWSCRDSDGDGCLEVWCTWDTGDDNNTRYLINRIHARAVVDYSYRFGATLRKFYSDACSTRVNGVFHKLLYNRRRALDYLACGYKLENASVQQIYLHHGIHHLNLSFSLFLQAL